MGTYTKTYNLAVSPQDNGSFINKRIYKIKECENTLIQNNLADLWNNNLCAQDEAYCQPWIAGDKIYFQYRNDRDESFSKIIKIINQENGQIIPNSGLDADNNPYTIITTEEGQDINDTSYLNVIIDTTNIPVCCFYLRISLFFCEPDPALLSDCISSGVAGGKTLEQATYDCMVDLCNEENIVEIFSEPYCKVTCENTVLITGTYPKYDCDLNYYGIFNDDYMDNNSFTISVRVPGEIVQENYNITENIVNDDKTSSKMQSGYRLMTPKIPPYVANQIANAFNAQHLYVDGVEYKRGVSIEKNNDQGFMWIINTTLLRICDDIDFACQ